jgi:hypothetical protein
LTPPPPKGVSHKGQSFAVLGISHCSKKAQLGLGQDWGDMAEQQRSQGRRQGNCSSIATW